MADQEPEGYFVPREWWPTLARMMRDYVGGLLTNHPRGEERRGRSGGPRPLVGLLVTDVTHVNPGWAAILRPGDRPAVFVTLLGHPTGGTFTVGYDGTPSLAKTTPIPFDADAETLGAALTAIGVPVGNVHFSGTAIYELDGDSVETEPRRWLVEFDSDEAPDLVVRDDDLDGEARAFVQKTNLNLKGSSPTFVRVRLNLPHHPAYVPLRAGATVVALKTAGEAWIVSAEPRDWPVAPIGSPAEE
jgi:hypothetical protein